MADSPEQAEDGVTDTAEYRVLARKYRPKNFDELIGQDVLVRTLTNAIRLNRVHHAFVLTGVRGIGKTTTARIIARALNCIGPDGNGGPTIEPCGVCDRCQAIAEDRDVDVLEMDAASNTGVNDVREIIDSVRYSPVAARYKIYIIDEVHMLSTQAFNALLKSLEEPPEHVKFVFATTEIRKVPVTILSRCQRFDLRRLDENELSAHLTNIAQRETAAVSPEAIAVLARAADGSVRDGLSLLDQVIAQSDPEAGEVSDDQVRSLLGMADRSQTLDLFEKILSGDANAAIDHAGRMYRDGAAPLPLVQDLMDITHWLTRLKLSAGAVATGAGASQTDAARAAAMAEKLPMGVLTRTWQMLIKGINDIELAPQAMTALEMLIVRLCYVAELPTPGDLVARLEGQPVSASDSAPVSDQPKSDTGAGSGSEPSTSPAANDGPATASDPDTAGSPPQGATMARAVGDGLTPAAEAEFEPAIAAPDPLEEAELWADQQPAPDEPVVEAATGPVAPPRDFRELAELFKAKKEMVLYGQLYNDVHLVAFDVGRLEMRPEAGARRELSAKVAALLKDWTELRWIVTVSSEAGEPTLREQDIAVREKLLADAANDPLVRSVLDTFEGSKLTNVLEPAPAKSAGADNDDADGRGGNRGGDDT